MEKMELSKWFYLLTALTYTQSVPIGPKAEAEYRLPEGAVDVQHYTIQLSLKNDIFTTNEFDGVVTIQLKNLKNTKEIKLHSNGNSFTEVILTESAERTPVELEDQKFESDAETDILTIATKEELKANTNYTLKLTYKTKLRTDEMYGFYKSYYIAEDGETKVYLGTTQFQPTSARKAFPCFDEPSYKAIFAISIRHPSKYSAIGNTAGTADVDKTDNTYTTTTFAETPKMSTYLIAFVVSDFTCDENAIDENTKHFVCSRKEAAATRKTAVDVGPELVHVMESWTQINYSESGLRKMHQFAIPDFSAGAMENWGLLTYRETGLLWDENESSNSYLQSLINVVAHEISHMWFGNLVTTHWWKDTFLNEGFARYFQYHATAEIKPEWELGKQFVVAVLQGVLASDSLSTSKALSSDVSSPPQISGRFGTISYNKGASVLRMILHFMGIENFKTGIRTYLKTNKFGNTKPENLWNALQTAVGDTLPTGTTLLDVVDKWVNIPGYPLLEVKTEGLTVTISQKRFLTDETSDDNKWYVPISYTLSTDTKKFEDTSPRAWLLPSNNLTLGNILESENSWIILNNQQTGFYRVKYDDTLWCRIQETLFSDNFNDIDEISRAQIIDDYYNFAKIGLYSNSKLLDLYKFLEKDTSYFSWYSALNAFSSMIARTGNEKLRENLSKYILNILNNTYHSVPFNKPNNDNQVYSLKRSLVISWACRLGLSDCVDQAVEAFKDYKEIKHIRPDKNIKSVIFCNGLRHSKNISTDWDHVWNDYVTTRLATEQVTILTALGCAKDKEVLNKYLSKSIDASSGIRQQDALSVFSSVYTGNPEGVDIAFEFLENNYQEISKYYGSMNSLSSLITNLANRFTHQDQIDKLEEFLKKSDLTESLKQSGEAALKSAKANLQWTIEFEKELTKYFKTENSAAVTGNGTFFLITVLVICYQILY